MPPFHPRIATTHELMLPYAADLLRQKAKGASHGQMLSWLHTQGVMVNMGEISSFWPYLAEKQKEQQKQQQPQLGQQKQEQETQKQQPGVPPPNRPCGVAPSGGLTAGDAPVLLAYVFDLIGLRAAGKSDAELVAWLRTNKKLDTNRGEITKVFDYYQEHRDEIEDELQQAWERHLEHPPTAQPSPLRLDRGEGQGEVSNPVNLLTAQPSEEKCPPNRPCGVPPPNRPCGIAPAGDAEKPKQPAEEKFPPMASGGLTASGEYDISEVMADYEILVARQVRRDKLAPEPDRESQKITERMVRTLMMYKHSLERRQERLAALKIKQAAHELNVKKAAAAAERAAQAGSGAPKAKDFDNTQLIKEMRHEMFKDEFTPEKMAEVDRMILECDKKALAEGIKFIPYVPPDPLPTTAQPAPLNSQPPALDQQPVPATPPVPIIGSDAISHPLRLASGEGQGEVSNIGKNPPGTCAHLRVGSPRCEDRTAQRAIPTIASGGLAAGASEPLPNDPWSPDSPS